MKCMGEINTTETISRHEDDSNITLSKIAMFMQALTVYYDC